MTITEVRNDDLTTQAAELAALVRGAGRGGLRSGWLRPESAWAFYAQHGAVRQMIGRFATLMTKPAWHYTRADVKDFNWSPTQSMLDDIRLRTAMRVGAVWAFVFGAGIIEHVVDDANRGDETKLDLKTVRSYTGLIVHSAYDLHPENGSWRTADWFVTVRTAKPRRIHRSRLSIMVTGDTPVGTALVSSSTHWPPSWLEGIYSTFTRWDEIDCDVSAIVHSLSILHVQLEGYRLAVEQPDSVAAEGVRSRIAQGLEGLANNGVLVTDVQDKLSEIGRSITGLADLMERTALNAAASAGVPKELLLMEAEGNLGNNSAPIDAYYDMITGWGDDLLTSVINTATDISLAVQAYDASLFGETLVTPTQYVVMREPIQQESGKELAGQRKSNSESRKNDIDTGVPLDVVMSDQDLRDQYPELEAWLEAKSTRETEAAAKAAQAGIDDPVDEDMVAAAVIAKRYSISPSTLIKMAMSGAIPGRKIAGRWKFYLSRVVEAMREPGTQQQAHAPEVDHRLDAELSDSTTFGDAWGVSAAMREIFSVLEAVRDSKLAVLLLGETGTGKEGIARGLHVSGPFVAMNCAELDDDAPKAAAQLRRALTAAAGGTLLLDEVADVPRGSQAALLRLLSGDHSARIVSATSQDVRDGWLFRQDLYHRLAEVEVEIPPLRDRETDVLEIARRIYAGYTDERGYEAADPPFTDSAIASMLIYPWPGNIRELKSAVCRGVEICPRAQSIGSEHMQLSLRGER